MFSRVLIDNGKRGTRTTRPLYCTSASSDSASPVNLAKKNANEDPSYPPFSNFPHLRTIERSP